MSFHYASLTNFLILHPAVYLFFAALKERKYSEEAFIKLFVEGNFARRAFISRAQEIKKKKLNSIDFFLNTFYGY